MKIENFFKKIYCINLDRRTDRWEECKIEFKKNNLDCVERYSAVDKTILNNEKNSVFNGWKALILTNIQIIEYSLSLDFDSILILEDDVEFLPTFNDISTYLDQLPEDWDMVYFGGNHNTHVGSKEPKSVDKNIIRLHNTYSTHAVGIKKKSYNKILERIKKMDNPLDVMYVDLQSQLNVYGFSPGVATQRESFSDIENKFMNNKWLIK
jgi:GR25 family glycosyltransferase involved in LPS biosynthesis